MLTKVNMIIIKNDSKFSVKKRLEGMGVKNGSESVT